MLSHIVICRSKKRNRIQKSNKKLKNKKWKMVRADFYLIQWPLLRDWARERVKRERAYVVKLGKNEASPVYTPPVGDDGVDSFLSATVLIVERERERERREKQRGKRNCFWEPGIFVFLFFGKWWLVYVHIMAVMTLVRSALICLSCWCHVWCI